MSATSQAGAPGLNRRMITATVMLTSILQTLDNTIANVALPHMQGSLSATQEQVGWVLTSYIVAAAIATPLAGWVATQIGRRRLFLMSVIGFTITSVLCGAAQTIGQIVLFRFLQGIAGAALVPISQAVLFDINPPERHGKAMAAWAQGTLLGPMLGPIIGGWLTDHYNWRWVFYINLPLGLLAIAGVLAYLPKEFEARRSRFQFAGFALLSIAVAAFQLVLDRGPIKDWFDSPEIRIEAVVSGLALYLFIVHSATSPQPFIRPALFADRNYLTGNVFIFVVGIVLFATLALLPTMLQVLLHYPVYQAGLLVAPRSLGTLLAMGIAGQLVGKIDSRWIVGVGFAITVGSLWYGTLFNTLMDARPVFWSGFLQGAGTGAIYVPMATMAFATLPTHLRDEGTAFFSLMRNLGSSVGISAVQALLSSNTQRMHAALTMHVVPYNLANRDPRTAAALLSPEGIAGLNARITAQASMVGYIDNFWLMMVVTAIAMPLVLLMRKPKPGKVQGEEIHVAME